MPRPWQLLLVALTGLGCKQVLGIEYLYEGDGGSPDAGDGSDARIPMCRDGYTDGDEECDDGDEDDFDGCRNDCTKAYCGDGVRRVYVEECEPGIDASCTSGCRSCAGGIAGPDGHCYTVDPVGQPATWDAAELACAGTGGHLLTFDSAEDEDTIAQLLPVMDYWLGTRRAGAEVEFVWVEGVPIYFPVWDAGEPNLPQDMGACVVRTNSGLWRDEACSQLHSFICEKDPRLLDPVTNHAYWVGYEEQGWLDVTGDCGGTHLATLTSAAEDDVIDPLIGRASRWIGFHDRDVEGDYKWVTTEPFAFTDWGMDEPTGSIAESCGGRCGATWCDLGCGPPRTFVCEAD